MSEEEVVEADTGKKKGKKTDYCEVEFEIGNIEFEAKGRSIVVERMFRMLLEKIEEGKLVAEFKLEDPEDDEEEEEEEEKKEEETTPVDTPSEPEVPEPPSADEPTLDPPPEWDSLETEEPEVSDAEREELGIE
ncbi:MAG: hypothetical protein ACW97G_00750 [Candidatus Thorarchaeota archaeon]|jgi:hypothetical protein